jgi:hypothetical protein
VAGHLKVPHLRKAYSRLPHDEHVSLDLHLTALAEAAEAAQDATHGESKWSDLAGLRAGNHRQLFGDLWLSYCIDPQEHVVRLLDLGDASLTSRLCQPRPPSAWRREGPAEDVWNNEGGSNHSPRVRNLRIVKGA